MSSDTATSSTANNEPRRAFCFTINNPGDGAELPTFPGERYVIWQLEAGESGTKHWQGYIELEKPARFSAFKKPERGVWSKAHLEPRRGTRDQARDYCRKDEGRLGGPWERGKWASGGSGARTDIGSAVDTLRATGSLKRVAEEHPEVFIRYSTGLMRYEQIALGEPRAWKTELHVLWGQSGAGKTATATAEATADRPPYFLPRSDGKLWADGFQGENVIIDDFYGWIRWDELLKLADRSPMQVERKGGHVQWNPKKLYITSNSHWTTWYNWGKYRHMRPEALARRITSCREFTLGDRTGLDEREREVVVGDSVVGHFVEEGPNEWMERLEQAMAEQDLKGKGKE